MMVAKTKYVGALTAAAGALVAIGLLLLTMLWSVAGPAKATFPGPNGKIVYSGQDQLTGDYEIYKISSTSPTDGIVFDTPVQLTNNKTDDFDPSYSANGKKIAYAGYDGNDYEIRTMNVGGGGKVWVTNNDRDDFDPAYSPDGSKIVYNHEGVNDTELYTIGVTTEGTPVGAPVKLTTNDTDDSSPSYSPKGDRIAYESGVGTNTVIYTIGVTTEGTPVGAPVQVTTNDTVAKAPSYSPKGDRIAYEGGVGTVAEIYTIGVTTEGMPVGAPVQVTNYKTTHDGSPSYSPTNGDKIAYAGVDGIDDGINDGIDHEIYKINATGGHPTPLTSNEAEDLDPDWGIRP